MSRSFTPVQKIEQSIVRRYHEELWSPFCKAIKRYETSSLEAAAPNSLGQYLMGE